MDSILQMTCHLDLTNMSSSQLPLHFSKYVVLSPILTKRLTFRKALDVSCLVYLETIHITSTNSNHPHILVVTNTFPHHPLLPHHRNIKSSYSRYNSDEYANCKANATPSYIFGSQRQLSVVELRPKLI